MQTIKPWIPPVDVVKKCLIVALTARRRTIIKEITDSAFNNSLSCNKADRSGCFDTQGTAPLRATQKTTDLSMEVNGLPNPGVGKKIQVQTWDKRFGSRGSTNSLGCSPIVGFLKSEIWMFGNQHNGFLI